MRTVFKITLLAGLFTLCGAANAVAPVLVATYTVDVTKLTDNIVFARCSKIITVPPDSDVIDFYDDNTFIETVTVGGTPSYAYGYWGQVDGAKWSKFRFTYTGNAGERTGSWGTYIANMETVAGAACAGTTVEAYGGTLRVLRADLTVKTAVPHTGTGTANSKFQTELYGYDLDYGMYGKGTERRSTLGTFVWY